MKFFMRKNLYLFSVTRLFSVIIFIGYIGGVAQTALAQETVDPVKTAQAFFERAIANGDLRPATREDIQIWVDKQDIPPMGKAGQMDLSSGMARQMIGKNAYVMLKPIEIPSDWRYFGQVVFFLPEGVSYSIDKVPFIRSCIYDLNTGLYEGDNCLDIDGWHIEKELPTATLEMERVAELPSHCQFTPSLQLPEDYYIYVSIGARDPNRNLPFQVDHSDTPSTEATLYVNVPDKPVILMLMARSTITQIKWTPATKIVAIYVYGYGTPIVAGLPEETPVMFATKENGCNAFAFSAPGRYLINPISRNLFNKTADFVFTDSQKAVAYVGEVVDHSQYIQARIQPAESFKLDVPLVGIPALKQALEQGILRMATEDDLHTWLEAREKYFPDAPQANYAFLFKDIAPQRVDRNVVYTALKSFAPPRGISKRMYFFIPVGVERPESVTGDITIFDANDGSCIGVHCPVSRDLASRH